MYFIVVQKTIHELHETHEDGESFGSGLDIQQKRFQPQF